jgi:hypothetical protein
MDAGGERLRAWFAKLPRGSASLCGRVAGRMRAVAERGKGR